MNYLRITKEFPSPLGSFFLRKDPFKYYDGYWDLPQMIKIKISQIFDLMSNTFWGLSNDNTDNLCKICCRKN